MNVAPAELNTRGQTWKYGLAMAVCMAAAVALQVVRDRIPARERSAEPLMYVRSGRVMQRMALSFDALAADTYWVRALQHYGDTKRSTQIDKKYDLLYPLLDLTTTLDPRFSIAYRFGAIFLAEAFPNGPGRPDLAVALLKKGTAAQPEKWQYLQDVGFVYYWWLHDYNAAATYFKRASDIPGAPWWMRSLAAATLAAGGDRQASRTLWENMAQTSDNDWLKREAERRLLQLRALDDIDRLVSVIQRSAARRGEYPTSWETLVQSGDLRAVPLDPAGKPYVLDARALTIGVSRDSPLFPLPTEAQAAAPPLN